MTQNTESLSHNTARTSVYGGGGIGNQAPEEGVVSKSQTLTFKSSASPRVTEEEKSSESEWKVKSELYLGQSQVVI